MSPIVKVRRARRAYRCDADGGSVCRTRIAPGDLYVVATLPPQRDPNYGDRWWSIRICEGCDSGDNIGTPEPRPDLTAFTVEQVAAR